jgi:hypothetical protein
MSFDLSQLSYPMPWFQTALGFIILANVTLLAINGFSIARSLLRPQLPIEPPSQSLMALACSLALFSLCFSIATLYATNHTLRNEIAKSSQASMALYWLWRKWSDCAIGVWLTVSSSCLVLLTIVAKTYVFNKRINSKHRGT